VAYLLPRFIEPTRGRVLFDGEDIAWGTLESIRTETAYVGGDDPILSGTVLDNILCGDPRYSLNDAIEAAKLVHAHKFISRLPQGYETILGEHGEQLEVGAAFRLGLARAALRDPAVMIIEEPQVLLDDDTKALIDDAYQRLSGKRTMIYLPGRLTTSRRCDQVIMLHDGKVEGMGAHQDLTKSCELYRHWDYLTFNTHSRRSRRMQKA
jgi:ABC-type multidrug transport system fused ATPase/permease subunit